MHPAAHGSKVPQVLLAWPPGTLASLPLPLLPLPSSHLRAGRRLSGSPLGPFGLPVPSSCWMCWGGAVLCSTCGRSFSPWDQAPCPGHRLSLLPAGDAGGGGTLSGLARCLPCFLMPYACLFHAPLLYFIATAVPWLIQARATLCAVFPLASFALAGPWPPPLGRGTIPSVGPGDGGGSPGSGCCLASLEAADGSCALACWRVLDWPGQQARTGRHGGVIAPVLLGLVVPEAGPQLECTVPTDGAGPERFRSSSAVLGYLALHGPSGRFTGGEPYPPPRCLLSSFSFPGRPSRLRGLIPWRGPEGAGCPRRGGGRPASVLQGSDCRSPCLQPL